MKKIIDILNEYQINGFESVGGTDKATTHSYDLAYEKLFESFIDKEITLLELGVHYGGSSLLWHEFFPKSKLVLMDIYDSLNQSIKDRLKTNRFDYHVSDAYTNETVLKLKSLYPDGFDIIIEDGPHSLNSQIFTVTNYIHLLKKGGILVIEDIQNIDHCETILKFLNNLEIKSSEIVDLRHIKNRYDDLLIVIKK